MLTGFLNKSGGIFAQNQLNKSNNRYSSILNKLSTGLKVNQAKDNPAALVISELLRSQTNGIYQSVRNNQETNNVLAIAEGGLSGVSSTLTKMKQLALHATNSGVTSNPQVSADQAELNGMLNSIAQVAATTSYSNQRLLNGSKTITPEQQNTTGQTQLQQTAATLSTGLAGGSDKFAADQEFTVTGAAGSETFSFAAGTSLADAVEAINQKAAATGVGAQMSADSGQIELYSREKGAAQSIQVDQTTGDAFAAAGDTVNASGADNRLGTAQQANIVDLAASTVNSAASAAGMNATVRFSGEAKDQAEKAYLETNLGGGQTLQSAQKFSVRGNMGEQTFSFAAGTSIAEMADAINQASASTGVSAYAIKDGSELRLTSQDYGSSQSVQVRQESGGAFAQAGQSVRDTGQDLTVNVNGKNVTGNGLEVKVSDGGFSGTLNFSAGKGSDNLVAANTAVAQTDYSRDSLSNADTARTANLSATSRGMNLQLGQTSGAQDRQSLSLPDASLHNLGKIAVGGETYSLNDLFSGGKASLSRNPDIAMQVIEQAVKDVAGMRADIGAYQSNTLQATNNSLSVALENIIATESGIRDADMAEEITNMTREQILMQAGIFGVQSIKKQQASLLKLLGGA